MQILGCACLGNTYTHGCNMQAGNSSLLSMFKQAKPAEPLLTNKKTRLVEPQLANKKPRLSPEASVKSGGDKVVVTQKSRPVGAYDRPWRAYMKQPASSKSSSDEGQVPETDIAADAGKKMDSVKKLQVLVKTHHHHHTCCVYGCRACIAATSFGARLCC